MWLSVTVLYPDTIFPYSTKALYKCIHVYFFCYSFQLIMKDDVLFMRKIYESEVQLRLQVDSYRQAAIWNKLLHACSVKTGNWRDCQAVRGLNLFSFCLQLTSRWK